MAEPYDTNQETVTVTTAAAKPDLKVQTTMDQYVTENDNGASIKVHASDAAWLKKRGLAT